MTTITMPTVLAFDRKLEPSDALMYSGKWEAINTDEAWDKIELFERRNRAVKSNFKQEVLEDEEELQKQIAEANLAWGDDAALLHEHDTLKVSFSLRIVSGIDQPSVCNKPEFEATFTEKVRGFIQNNLDDIARRYAYNIANGRFLWRNRVDAEDALVIVDHSSLKKPLEFKINDFSLRETSSSNDSVEKLAGLIKAALSGEKSTLLTINAYVQLGSGQRVWPSQEMVLNTAKGEKSRHLFSLNGCAAMHSEKIGNALRTIDDWYPSFEKTQQPIAIEAYGSVTQRGVAYRSSRNDFKTLLLKWLNDEELSTDDKSFVVAMIIRGGVFGEGES